MSVTVQCGSCRTDPIDKSCTDLSLFSVFPFNPQYLCFSVLSPLLPPPSLLPVPPLFSYSALSLLICVEMFWCSCCQRQPSLGTAPWETCKSVSLSTISSLSLSVFYIHLAVKLCQWAVKFV